MSIIKPAQTIIRNGIETVFAVLNTPSGIGLVYKRIVDIITENFALVLEEIIFSHDLNIKTYVMGDFNINLLDYSTSQPVEIYLNLISCNNCCPVILFL